MDWPVESARVEPTPEGPLAVLEAPPGEATANTPAILDWALEASARVLRGDPQPSDAEVYKAARPLLSS